MDIQPAGPQDLPEIIELLNTRGWDDSPTLERGTWYVARADDGSIVGCTQVVETEPGHAVIDQVLVREGFRERGIGRRLLAAAMQGHRGAAYLCCHPELLAFYSHFGFEDVGYAGAPGSIRDYWVLIEDWPVHEGHVHHYLRSDNA